METYSVKDLTTYIRNLLDEDEELQDVWVSGEISNMTAAASGHWYFTLKDDSAQLKGVMFKFRAERQSFQPENGDSVLVHGNISVYEARGEYQLYADEMQPAGGVGDLYRRFEELKAKLQAEGLFDEEWKRPIPAYPQKIGVVTSPTAAAFQDIQNVLRRRYPVAEVILSPTLVQGAEAPPQIVRAIERLNQHTKVDVILVSRGGGSIEDLWAFNDESVARAIADSRIPIISGVGHEIDFTIADFVADLRAPTPSAAAELATPNRDDLRLEIDRRDDEMRRMMHDTVSTMVVDLELMQQTLTRVSPDAFIRNSRQRIDELTIRLSRQQTQYLTLLRERLTARTSALHTANPEAILSRGYAIVTRSEDGSRIVSERDAAPGTGITIRLQKDELKARVEDKDAHERYKRTLF